jgi:hypothetical protein
MLYSADSESSNASHPGSARGIRVGSAKDGTIGGTSAAEGVAIDARGKFYGAEVGPKAVKKYVRP